MTLRQFLFYGNAIKDELLDKDIKIVAPNGLELTPVFKFVKKDEGNPNMNDENVDRCIITYD